MTNLTKSLARPGFSADFGAFWAVVRKEWLYIVRYPSWVVGLVIWPVIFPMAYLLTARALSGTDGSGLAQFQANTGVSDYIGYIVVGTTIWMWQNVVLWSVGFSLRSEQLRGTLESSWLSPTWRFTFLLGSGVPQLASMLMFLVVSALEFSLLFGVHFGGSLWLALLVILAAIPSIYGLGFAFASVVITAREAEAFVFLVRGLVMIFCGITFPIAMLPGWMQSVTWWLPQTYMIHAMRLAALTPATLADLAPDLLPLACFGLFWLAAGFILFNIMERRARQTGAIGQY
jgi:ABC-2 type transport system permease protein